MANWLRRIKAPVLLVTNKADNERRENERWEFLALGAGDPYPVSALHGRRAGDLLDEVISRLPPPEDDEGCWRLPGQAAVVLRLVPQEGLTR